jgi:hypothetical protein
MTELTDDAYLQPAVAAELTSLADLLDDASDAQWTPRRSARAGGSARWSRT